MVVDALLPVYKQSIDKSSMGMHMTFSYTLLRMLYG